MYVRVCGVTGSCKKKSKVNGKYSWYHFYYLFIFKKRKGKKSWKGSTDREWGKRTEGSMVWSGSAGHG
jgi:hypothetical protein